jgi:hypothetical protein
MVTDGVGSLYTQLLSWIAVFFRIYVRVKVLREPGLDDMFVISAVVRSVLPPVYFARILIADRVDTDMQHDSNRLFLCL